MPAKQCIDPIQLIRQPCLQQVPSYLAYNLFFDLYTLGIHAFKHDATCAILIYNYVIYQLFLSETS